MPKMQRIFIRIDPETGDLLRKWFTSQGTTLAGAIQDFLMDEYEKALDAAPDSEEGSAEDAAPDSEEAFAEEPAADGADIDLEIGTAGNASADIDVEVGTDGEA